MDPALIRLFSSRAIADRGFSLELIQCSAHLLKHFSNEKFGVSGLGILGFGV